MPTSCGSQFHRATTSVLVAVTVVSGAILVLGGRFDPAPGYTLTQPIRADARIAACVADESMRLIDRDRERCRSDELELVGPPCLATRP